MAITIIIALLSLTGVIIGAGLHYYFSRITEHEKHLRILKMEAYIDYIRSIGEMEQFGLLDPSDPRRKEAHAKAISSKAKVCACGSPEVVKALAKFESHREPGLTPEKKQLLIHFIEKMRIDIGGNESQVDKESIEAILF